MQICCNGFLVIYQIEHSEKYFVSDFPNLKVVSTEMRQSINWKFIDKQYSSSLALHNVAFNCIHCFKSGFK